MPSYLERYQQGEHQQVWTELVALGPAIRQEPLSTDAVAVAGEMMTCASHNIVLLIERLHTLNYRFAHPHQIRVAADDKKLLERLTPIEQRYGPLPLVLRMWFEVVGHVDLTGAHPKLSCYVGLVPPDQQGPLSDPLVVACYSTVEELEEYDSDPDFSPPYPFDIAPDADHKGNYSGSGPTNIEIPNPGFDAPLASNWWKGIYLVPYLRTCFQWGGFPGFDRAPRAAEDARVELEFLTKDLLPI